jgi:hypothetical protein
MAVIDSKKLLPSGKSGGSIVDTQKPFLVPVSNILYKKDVNISQKLLKPADRETQGSGGSLLVIKKKVLKIQDVIGNTYLIQQSENTRKRKEKERQKAEDREKKLETKPGRKVDFNSLPKLSLPGGSILDTIKRFIAFTFAGFLFDKYNKYLPKLLEFGKYIEPVTKFIDIFAKNAIDGVIKFIDLGYQTYDNVRKKIDDIGGKDAAKQFDKFSGELNKLLNGAIMASMLIASTAPRSPRGAAGGIGAGASRSLGMGAVPKPISGFGAGTGMTPGRYRAPGQASSRGFGLEQARKGLTFEQSVAARKAAQTTATQGAKGAARLSIARVPIIGALIGFIVDTVVFREKPSRAAAGAVGSAVGQGIGLALAGGTTFGLGAGVGLFVGGFLGDIVGKSLYDAFTGYQPQPTPAKAQGGQVRSGQSRVTPTRKIKTQRTSTRKTFTPTKVQPGRDIGGKLRVESLYGKDEPGKRSALRALVKSSTDLKKMRSLNGVAGGMLGAGVDMALGQKPDRKLANSLGNMFGSVVEAAINTELNSSFNDISKSIAMANGGVVPSREIGSGINIGERIGRYISNAFSIALESSASRVLQNLNQELNLEGAPPGGTTGPTGPEGNVPGAKLRSGSNAQIEADLLEYFTAIYGKNAAIGIVANIRRESGYRTATPDNPRFEGMVQWSRDDRWPKFVKWAQSKGLDPYNRNAQAQYIAIDINNHGIAGELKAASSPEEAASIFYNRFERGAHSKPVKGNNYTPDNPHENLNKQFISDITGRNPNIGSRASQVVVYPALSMTGYKPPTPGLFNAIQYITGDSTQGANYDPVGHGGLKYHEHIAFKTEADKERAKAALRAAGFVIGSEYRPGDRGYHGANLAIDVPFYGQKRKYSDNTSGERKFSADVRRVLGIGNVAPVQPRQNLQLQSSLSPTPSSTSNLIASIQQNPSYSQGGNTIVHDVNNIVMPVVIG